MKQRFPLYLSLAILLTASGFAQGPAAPAGDAFKDLSFRSLGPSLTTGRIQDVAIDPKNPSVWYVAVGVGEPVQDRQPRQHLDRGVRQLRLVLARRGHGRSEGLEGRVAGHGRERQPAERQLRRRDLQVDRRRRNLEADGARELRAHPEHRRRPAQLEYGLRHARSGRCGPRAATAASTRPPTGGRRGRRS